MTAEPQKKGRARHSAPFTKPRADHSRQGEGHQELDERLAPAALNVEAAAQFVGLGRSSLYELIRTGELPVCKIGRRTLVRVEALRELLARHERGRS